jgi:tRNA(Ile)-lysidine synthase
MDEARALSPEDFAAALLPLIPVAPDALALGVSGGRDSLALMHRCAGFAAPRGIRLLVLTVDHALRPESADEARAVGEAARQRGLAHRILTWQEGTGSGNLEARAREARYRLMAEACAQAGIGTLLLGHTRDDQAETVLMRLARGSGVDGLAAMAPVSRRLGLTLLRPLLDIPRARLEATLREAGLAWFDDPMNEDERFARVALRKARAVLAGAGLTDERLAATARHMARVRLALEADAERLAAEAVQLSPAGFCRFEPAPFLAAPEEIGLRLLARLIMAVGGQAYPPRFERLARLYAALKDQALGRGRTLGGCKILPAQAGAILILREAAALAPPLTLEPGRERLWDGRFRVQLAQAPQQGRATVGALGPEGQARLRNSAPEHLVHIAPAAARACLPSLWVEGRLAAVPHLGYAEPGFLPLAAGFRAAFTGL